MMLDYSHNNNTGLLFVIHDDLTIFSSLIDGEFLALFYFRREMNDERIIPPLSDNKNNI